MTAPDPRLGEITAEEEAILKAARALRDLYAEEVCKLPVSSFTKEARTALEAAYPYLLAELRKAHDALGRVEGLAEEWRYKGEHGWGPWQIGEGPDHEGWVLDNAASELRAAVAAATGGERG